MLRFSMRTALLSGGLILCLAAPCWAKIAVRQTAMAAVAASSKICFNYYVPAGPTGGVPAQMYPAPRPTPPHVGHTYVTYQPLMPHEFMTPHHRTYFGYQPDGGYTVTRVRYGYNPFNQVWCHAPKVLPNPRTSGHFAQKMGGGVATNPVHPVNLYGAPKWTW